MSKLSKFYLWMLGRYQWVQEKGWSLFGMFGVLIVVGLLGYAGNYFYISLKNTEKANILHDDLKVAFTTLSDAISKAQDISDFDTKKAIILNVFRPSLVQPDQTSVQDYWGNNITISYREMKEPSVQAYVNMQTIVSSPNRVQVCNTYLRVMENQRMKDYLRLVDAVTIIDRGNPSNNITFCAENSSENCKSDVWASLDDLNQTNREEICSFYCKMYPCQINVLLRQN